MKLALLTQTRDGTNSTVTATTKNHSVKFTKRTLMKTELETVKVIHIIESFPWSFEIGDNPDYPDAGIVIKHQQEGKLVERVAIPKCAIQHLIEGLTSFLPQNT